MNRGAAPPKQGRSFTSRGASRIVFSAGSLDRELRQELLLLKASRVLVVSSPSERAKGLAGAVVTRLCGEDDGMVATLCARAVQHVPEEVAELAREDARTARADTVVAIGGGSALGLAKAVALGLDVGLVMVPTTYSGSEVTNIYGITGAEGKVTGRNERCQAATVIYDSLLLQTMPAETAVPSLFNAMAHAVEALWADGTDPATQLLAEEGIRVTAAAAEALSSHDGGSDGVAGDVFDDALYGAYLCGLALNNASMAVHHKVCHVLGGAFGMPHCETHTVMLPHSMAFNYDAAPHAVERIGEALGGVGKEGAAAALYDLQRRCGVPTSLRQLAFRVDDLAAAAKAALQRHYANPRPLDEGGVLEMLADAFHGRRPSRTVTRRSLAELADISGVAASGPHARDGVPLPVSFIGTPIEAAHTVVVCVMGRFASAERILQMAEETFGVRAGVAFVAPQALASTWYPTRFLAPLEKNEPHLSSALSVLEATLAFTGQYVPLERTILFGFSQGACLVLEYAARSSGTSAVRGRLGGLVGLSGALIGPVGGRAEYSGAIVADGTPTELSVATEDSHVPKSYVRDTATVLRSLGARVRSHEVESDKHTIFPEARVRCRSLLDVVCSGVARGSGSRATGSGAAVAASGAAGGAGAAAVDAPSPFVLTGPTDADPHVYIGGLGAALQSEALAGALPRVHNSPKHVPYGLYAELLSGTAFTKTPRHENRRLWMYRIQPTVSDSSFTPLGPEVAPRFVGSFDDLTTSPELMRWAPLAVPTEGEVDFVSSITTYGGTGDPTARHGLAIHTYAANASMGDKAWFNADASMLVVPEEGRLDITTEVGKLRVAPGEIFVLPRGFKVNVSLPDGRGRGWLVEVFNGHFEVPGRGPIGSNHGADERHFLTPRACYEDRPCPGGYKLWSKHGGRLYERVLSHSPFDVVAWHGSYVPYKYDLSNFSPVGSAKWDHIDPSALTVLTCQMDTTGQAICDFIAFNGRWAIAEDSFGPPFFHRNCATEFNGVVKVDGAYSGFDKGVAFNTPYCTGHGVAKTSVENFLKAPDEATNKPLRLSDDSLWIMFESTLQLRMTPWALEGAERDTEFRKLFSGYARTFDPSKP